MAKGPWLRFSQQLHHQTQWKCKLRAQAQRLYPGIKVTLSTADALLLLEFALQSQATRFGKVNPD